jgi:hypothetical protein
MPAFICTACGTQYAPSEATPPRCIICEDERQFVPPQGQTWTTLAELAASHFNAWRQHEPGVIGIGTEPRFAIGQRAIILLTEHGNVLWDCIAMVDDATVTLINALGGLKAIAISHPHFYTSMVEWSRAFGNVPSQGSHSFAAADIFPAARSCIGIRARAYCAWATLPWSRPTGNS